jgi:hypothetical protein
VVCAEGDNNLFQGMYMYHNMHNATNLDLTPVKGTHYVLLMPYIDGYCTGVCEGEECEINKCKN